MPTGKVLLFGDINVDNVYTIPELPIPGRDVYASHGTIHLGGTVCNTAVVLQRLGQPTTLLGATGQDLWADYILHELNRAGVDSSQVTCKSQEGSGLIFIAVTPNGERTMFCYRGANTSINPSDLSEATLDDVNLVQLSGYVFLISPQRETAWRLIEMARDRRIPISMDSGLDPVVLQPGEIQRVLPHINLLVTGEDEAARLSGKSELEQQGQALCNFGIEQVSIKLGKCGAFLAWHGGNLHLPAFPVQVKDTTGAGDAFSAGLIYAYLHGFSPCASLTLANALGGLSTTFLGAAWIGREEILPFLEYNLKNDQAHPASFGISEVIQSLSA